MPVTKLVITEREGLKVVRLSIPAGQSVPTHSSSVDVVAVVVRGSGTFFLEGKPIGLTAGVTVAMQADAPHSLSAGERDDLELVVVHCRLAAGVAVRCGA